MNKKLQRIFEYKKIVFDNERAAYRDIVNKLREIERTIKELIRETEDMGEAFDDVKNKGASSKEYLFY